MVEAVLATYDDKVSTAVADEPRATLHFVIQFAGERDTLIIEPAEYKDNPS